LTEEREENLSDLSSDDIEVVFEELEEQEGFVEEQAGEAPEPEEPEAPEGPVGENEKYLRLYAEFENYKKRMVKDKEELARFANESLIYDLLPSLDNLETALKHANDDEASKGLVEGVEITLREFYRILEKFGLKQIEAEGMPFNPEFHHAISQVERNDMEEKMVVEKFRSGFMYRDKVLRAALVSVSQKPPDKIEEAEENENNEFKEES
jgi:molecular chaperone GrpE